jgi:hypothetical protein
MVRRGDLLSSLLLHGVAPSQARREYSLYRITLSISFVKPNLGDASYEINIAKPYHFYKWTGSTKQFIPK